MPAEKFRKLTDEQKASIVIAKETRPTATSTNQNLAKEFDCSESLVDHLNFRMLTDEQKRIYNLKRDDLKYLAQNLTYNAMQEANNRVLSGQGKLSEVVGAMKIANDIYRLETGQATSINEDRGYIEAKNALQSLVRHCPGMSLGDAVEAALGWGVPRAALERAAGEIEKSLSEGENNA